ncbi:hypothetical protein ACFL0C_00570 [Patescibacteria group bacterium]
MKNPFVLYFVCLATLVVANIAMKGYLGVFWAAISIVLFILEYKPWKKAEIAKKAAKRAGRLYITSFRFRTFMAYLFLGMALGSTLSTIINTLL